MAVNKNFVVKNGLEVAADALVVSSENKNVGVGTTVGQVLLDVRGAIGATHLSVSGVGTVVTLNSTNFTGTAGTITTLTSTDGTITNLTGTSATFTNGTVTNLTGTAGTITTFNSTNGTITNGTITNLTGTAGTITTFVSTDSSIVYGTINNLVSTAGTITTIDSINGTITNGTITNLTGTAGTIATFESTDGTIAYFNSTIATLTNLTGTAGTITNGTITNLTGTAGTITNGTITNLTGTAGTITTFNSTNASVTNFTPVNVNVSGVITATTYYGDGSNLSNVGGYWAQNDAGIHTTGSVGVGTTNPNSIVPSDNTSILNVGILTAYKLYGDGSALTGLAGNPVLQTVLDTGNTSTTGMSVTGVSTFVTAEVTNGTITNLTGTAGTITTLTSTNGTITNGTITNLIGTAGTITTLSSTNLLPTNINSSGVTTVATLDVQTKFDVYDNEAVFHNDVYIAGNLSIGGTTTSFTAQDLKIIDADIILGVTTTPNGDDVSTDTTANHGGIAVASTAGSPLVPFKVTGINTLPDTYKQLMWVKGGSFGAGTTDAWMSNYAVGVGSTMVPTGVVFAAGGIQFTDSTITTPTVTIGSGIVTATSGIVTYYGDGQFLSNVISGVGINTAGGNVGYGVTLLDFRGSGISTVTFDSATGIGTINIKGGDSTQIIKDTFTVSGSQSVFDLSQTYTTGTLDVYLNGVKLNSADYTETDSDTITLASAAVDGDILEVLNFKATGSLIAPVPIVETESFAVGVGTLITLNLSSAQDHKVTATGITTITCSGGTEGESHTVRIVNSGIATVGFSTYFLFPSGSPPSLPTASGTINLISFTVHRVGAGGTQLLAGASVNFS